MREIVLDTETTGLDPRSGDRLIELGCIELYNRIPTGREYHCYINPERDVPEEAVKIHGITTDMVRGARVFSMVVDEFLSFIGDAPLVIHNAGFDIAFLNFELERVRRRPLPMERVVDTLALARRKHPAGPNTLDALCKRYGIDNTKRIKHGAIMDSLLLAGVYVELLGERQAAFGLRPEQGETRIIFGAARPAVQQRPQPLPPRLTAEAEAAHRAFVETLGEKALWKAYW